MSIAGALGWRGLPVAASLAVALSPVPRYPVARVVAAGSPPSISIASPVQDDAIAGSVVVVRLSAAPPSNLYAYVTVDRPPPPVGQTFAATIVRSKTSTVNVPIAQAGTHHLIAVYGDAGRIRAGTASDVVTVSVAGPFLKATASPTSVEGDPWTIKVTVPAAHPLAKSGRGDRLVFVIDGELPLLGQPVPTDVDGVVIVNVATVPFPGLDAGPHAVWVLLVDGNDKPLEPYLATLQTVNVTA